MSRGGSPVAVAAQQLIAVVGPLGAPQATIDFQNIPATFKHLRLVLSVRTDLAATSDPVYLSFNNDAVAANYDGETQTDAGAVVTPAETLAAADARIIALATGATAPANQFADSVVDIIDYRNAARFSLAVSSGATWKARTAGNVDLFAAMVAWASIVAVNRVTLTPKSAGNFIAGTLASLYGLT